MAHKPVGAAQTLAVTGAAATTSAFVHQSDTVRIVSVGTSCHVAVSAGSTPSAEKIDYFIRTDSEATLSIGSPGSQRVVGITTGTNTIIDFPEGTGSPFNVGDFVSLTVNNQDYYNFTHKRVNSVNNSAAYNGYFNTRVVVGNDSSGIVTAYNSGNAAELRSSFKVSGVTPGSTGTIYVQQVQVSGVA